jgi:hypothetical protein
MSDTDCVGESTNADWYPCHLMSRVRRKRTRTDICYYDKLIHSYARLAYCLLYTTYSAMIQSGSWSGCLGFIGHTVAGFWGPSLGVPEFIWGIDRDQVCACNLCMRSRDGLGMVCARRAQMCKSQQRPIYEECSGDT